MEAVRAKYRTTSTAGVRCHTLWVLLRLGELNSTDLELALNDSDAIVRIHAYHVIRALPAVPSEIDPWNAKLLEEEPRVQRAAVMAAAEHPHRAPIDDLKAPPSPDAIARRALASRHSNRPAQHRDAK